MQAISETSTACAALRDKFTRVYQGKGTEQEANHVLSLIKPVREQGKEAHAQHSR
jgi:hypothetical protein